MYRFGGKAHKNSNAKCADRFLQTAEMLKPSTPSASHDTTGSSGGDDGAEYYPHIGDLSHTETPKLTHQRGIAKHKFSL